VLHTLDGRHRIPADVRFELRSRDAGVAAATLNSAQQIGAALGTAVILIAGAAAALSIPKTSQGVRS